ncbi:hypothetical protein GMOD_00008411 [Pyrenophora seminiperda CCB06]|uniref:Uncharacterized protein n=1 Tax=Pyrenophora seminiperda CCB06 TaxID=1302712 RepID=A0A3M7M8S6_9PLEO|nr:hypothetical protein GMOD_00008411 [Pyrenophora seminiperda CCB06]
MYWVHIPRRNQVIVTIHLETHFLRNAWDRGLCIQARTRLPTVASHALTNVLPSKKSLQKHDIKIPRHIQKRCLNCQADRFSRTLRSRDKRSECHRTVCEHPKHASKHPGAFVNLMFRSYALSYMFRAALDAVVVQIFHLIRSFEHFSFSLLSFLYWHDRQVTMPGFSPQPQASTGSCVAKLTAPRLAPQQLTRMPTLDLQVPESKRILAIAPAIFHYHVLRHFKRVEMPLVCDDYSTTLIPNQLRLYKARQLISVLQVCSSTTLNSMHPAKYTPGYYSRGSEPSA